jgi:hypothetical protein
MTCRSTGAPFRQSSLPQDPERIRRKLREPVAHASQSLGRRRTGRGASFRGPGRTCSEIGPIVAHRGVAAGPPASEMSPVRAGPMASTRLLVRTDFHDGTAPSSGSRPSFPPRRRMLGRTSRWGEKTAPGSTQALTGAPRDFSSVGCARTGRPTAGATPDVHKVTPDAESTARMREWNPIWSSRI